MICTAKYDNVSNSDLRLISISEDIKKNKDLGLEVYDNFIPSDKFLDKYKNINNSSFDLKKEYIKDYWNEVLSDLNPYFVIKELFHSIVVSYDNSDDLCYRHVIASWFELFLGDDIYEVVIDKEDVGVLARPNYIKEVLEDVIKSSLDMKGFNSVQALCFHENSKVYFDEALAYEKKNNLEMAFRMREIAEYLEETSLEIEKYYNGNVRTRKE